MYARLSQPKALSCKTKEINKEGKMIDKQLVLSDGQDVRDFTDVPSDYYVDLSVARDIGKGKQLYVVVQIPTVMVSSGKGATLIIALQTDDNADFNTPVSVLATQAYTEAVLLAGRQPIVIPIPPDTDEQYLRILYTVGGEAFTSGGVDAFITTDLQTNY